MAMTLERPQTPEMLGIPPESAARLLEAGGKLELPPARAYIRLGRIEFPLPRHLLLHWEVWPSKAAAREMPRKVQPQLQTWLVSPEPNVIRKEECDADGKVMAPALYTPTFDEVMALPAAAAAQTVKAALDAIRTAAYVLAAQWPDFLGAEQD